jgi:SNF2 family DNA or RNA helicase
VLLIFLKNRPENISVHASRYQEFKAQLLNRLDGKLKVDYQYIKTATELQLKQQGLNEVTERIIYLSDFGQHVMLNPVIRYGDAEVAIRSKKLIYGVDKKGEEYKVQRVEEDETTFTALLIRQHTEFEEQVVNDLDYFYLHKRHFLQEDWFLKTFNEWQEQGITVLGFNEIEGNKLNPNKIRITIKVLSGINWFNTVIDVRFGKKKATLKQVQRAVKNKSKYIQLDDGSQGILPAEWLDKFTGYFNSGEIIDDENLRTPKINFSEIEMLYEQQMLDDAVKNEISYYRERMNDFESISEVALPPELNGTLREYQKQGLNWLNFLDDFNFGGCLADDMGLGKTMQIIAFILLQRSKTIHNVNLLVVPTSLIFNWQAEVAKFAPSIKIHTIYGAGRVKSVKDFKHYEIIITSYGTLLADIVFLKDYEFNYVFLDESQYIKNPESQRYRSVKLLKARNKIVITGTPIENNTFDLYGQLSFACPGLLGSKQYFRDVYLAPIDQFNNKKRAQELQNKIKPFVLRRTKHEVAKELPDKTEMVLYCEMGEEQRSIYNAYEKEFREYISATTNDDLRKSPMNLLKGLTRLRQICDSPMLLKGDKLPGEQSAKIDMLMDEIKGKMGQHKILVFSQFVSMLDLIRTELVSSKIDFAYLTGSTRNRERVVNEFQTNNDVRVFLISLKAGGTGLNLTEADYVYLVDPWWNPAVENQAIDRSHRIGQNKHIVAVRLICPDTVEEKMMRVQETKKELFKDLISNNNSFISSLSKQELLGLVGWHST